MVGGGDGTISAAAAAAARSGKTLGILPLGTMNLFARSLGMPLGHAGAAEAIAGGEKGRGRHRRGERPLFVHHVTLGLHARMILLRTRMSLPFAARKDPGEHPGLVDGGPRSADASTRASAPIELQIQASDGGDPGDQQSARRGAHPLCRRSPPRNVRALCGEFAHVGRTLSSWRCAWRSAASRRIRFSTIGWRKRSTLPLGRAPCNASVDGEIVSLETPLRCRCTGVA